MEERILDDEKGKRIRLVQTEEGERDVAEEGEETEGGEVLLDLPEEDYGEGLDEDLIGLTPSQLEKELQRRKKAEEEARAECAKLLEEARAALSQEQFEEAAQKYEQALTYDIDSAEALSGLWEARTHGFTSTDALYGEEVEEELQRFPDASVLLRARFGSRLEEEREAYAQEESDIRPQVESAQAERREAFAANRKYYTVRTCIAAFVFALLAIGIAISADSIFRTQSILPIVLTAVFSALTLAAFGVTAYFSHKLYVACGLYKTNEREDATALGARLALLERRLRVLAVVLQAEE